MDKYPKYLKYGNAKKHPSVLDQHFPVMSDLPLNGKRFYPRIGDLEPFLETGEQSVAFGAAAFCGFLHDTIAVEHNLVIPAIASLQYLSFRIPYRALEDLFLLVADEGHHAAQAMTFLNSISERYGFEYQERHGEPPQFLCRLNAINSRLGSEAHTNMSNVIAGVVTETRVSIELGEFAKNADLIDEVRDTCRSHQEDEVIHSSQFRALGAWMWAAMPADDRDLAGELFAKILISRSLPDVRRIAFYLRQVTKLSKERCCDIVKAAYTPEALEAAVLLAARPTLRYLDAIGIAQTRSFQEAYRGFDYGSV
jgi:hypothetical protein